MFIYLMIIWMFMKMFVCTSRYFFYIHLYISASLNHITIWLSSHLINHSTISMASDEVLNHIMVIDIFVLSEQKLPRQMINFKWPTFSVRCGQLYSSHHMPDLWLVSTVGTTWLEFIWLTQKCTLYFCLAAMGALAQ